MAAEDAQPDPEPIESVDSEEADVLLADPDDYHQSQRLRQIHKARQQVHDVLQDIERWTSEKEHRKQERKLAQAVSLYISELEPLIEQTEYEIELPDGFPFDSVHQYVNGLGHHLVDDDVKMASYNESMLIFRRCNSFLGQVKPLVSEDEDEPGYLDL